MEFSQASLQGVREEANSILEKIQTNFYSTLRLLHNQVNDTEKYEACLKEVKKVTLQVQRSCPSFTLDWSNSIGLLTLTVNGLVVASCTLEKRVSTNGTDHSHIEIYCTIGNDTTHRYLLEEAERVSLAHGLGVMTIDVNLTKLKSHIDLRFFPIHVDDISNNNKKDGSVIVEMMGEVTHAFENELQDAPYQRSRKGMGNFARNILNGAIGNAKTAIFEERYPDLIDSWGGYITQEKTHKLVNMNTSKITLVKMVSSDNFEKYPVTYKTPTSVISSLGEATSRFMDLIKVNVRPLSDDLGELNNVQDFSRVVCRGSVADGFIQGEINRAMRGADIAIMTAEVSGLVIGLCILEFIDLVNHNNEPYMYVHLICARQHSGIGRHLLSAAERIALRNGVDVIRLSALPNVVDWYQKMSYRTGGPSYGNDPDKVGFNTPMMDRVLPDIIKMIKRMINQQSIVNSKPEEIEEMKNKLGNDVVRFRLLRFLNDMYQDSPLIGNKTMVDTFNDRYGFLMIAWANYLNTNKRGVAEIIRVDSYGIGMSKHLKLSNFD